MSKPTSTAEKVAEERYQRIRAEGRPQKETLLEFIRRLDAELPVPAEDAVPDLGERHDYYATQHETPK